MMKETQEITVIWEGSMKDLEYMSDIETVKNHTFKYVRLIRLSHRLSGHYGFGLEERLINFLGEVVWTPVSDQGLHWWVLKHWALNVTSKRVKL